MYKNICLNVPCVVFYIYAIYEMVNHCLGDSLALKMLKNDRKGSKHVLNELNLKHVSTRYSANAVIQ